MKMVTGTLRPLAVGLLTATLATAAGLALAHQTMTTLQKNAPLGVDDLTAAVLTSAGALVALWYAISAVAGTVCLLLRGLGGVWNAGEQALRRHGAPGVARLLGAGTGAVLTAALVAGPAHATVDEVPDDLTWGASISETAEEAPRPLHDETPLAGAGTAPAGDGGAPREAPDRHAAADQEAPAPDPAPASETISPGTSRESYQVQPGDSLWSIAADALGPEATTADIGTAWPEWYTVNRDLIGPDPDLIHPGDELYLPTQENTR
ncbi:LysM peptidoglycan-binding domain-containing protein [Ruania alkalisoli]|nr:LysM domain-containing protein [Ruania alkalisoli]